MMFESSESVLELLKLGSSLFSVVFKPAGFIGFHSVTDSCFLAPGSRQRNTEVGTDLRAVRLCGGPTSAVVRPLQWSVSADAALSEKSPYLGGARVRCVRGRLFSPVSDDD